VIALVEGSFSFLRHAKEEPFSRKKKKTFLDFLFLYANMSYVINIDMF
jgi:hypothetical protein